MKGLSDNRSAFAQVELACVIVSAAMWFAWPGLSWQPLLLACAPWALRLAAGRFPLRRTPFDIPLGVFLLMAGVGVWVAYDPEKAWAKFWLLVASALLFYALAGQDKDGLWRFAGFLSALGVFLAVYFLLTNDWQAQQTKFSLINQVGEWWMSVRPAFRWPQIHPNNAASLMAVMLPFSFAGGLAAWRVGRSFAASIWLLASGVTGVVLLLTSSRGAFLSLALILSISFLWGLSDLLAGRSRRSRGLIFVLLLLPLLLGGLGLFWMAPGGVLRLLDSLPGPASASNRVEIARNTLFLVTDFPFTGGGLGAFPGLYSQYILVVPFFYIEYSHNLFLEIAVGQGIPGLVAFTAVLVGSAWLLILELKTRPSWLAWAALASLAILCLHGLVTDAVYGERGSPFVFLHAGLALALVQPHPKQSLRSGGQGVDRASWKLAGIGVALLLMFALLYGFRRSFMASWYANLGAVEMARIELVDFPAKEWDDGKDVALFDKAAILFDRALRYRSDNRTANHRLGLIAGLRKDYSTTTRYLEIAYRASPQHRGIQKALGYSYVWTGQFDQAAKLLNQIPEAGYELKEYARWWRRRGRDDLAVNAGTAAENLAAGNR